MSENARNDWGEREKEEEMFDKESGGQKTKAKTKCVVGRKVKMDSKG